MQRFLVALLASAALVTINLATRPAKAADLPVKPRPIYKAPAYVVPPFTWSGFYVGGNLGWGWGTGDGTISFGGPTGNTSGYGDGFLGGVQLGYNWQAGAFVLGAEADFQGSTGKGQAGGNAGGVSFIGDVKTPWFGTVRGRLGYAFDRTMVYATGGGLYGKSTLDGTVSTTGPFSASAKSWAWTVGGGVETMLWDHWSAKLEYLYVDTPKDVPEPPGTTSADGTARTNIVRAGVNYHF
jgi:outer membrane immunogenic protein